MGYTASGLLLGANTVGGGWLSDIFKNNSAVVAGIPQQWVDVGGKEVYQYANYILGMDLKNITPRMVLAPHFKSRRKVQNSLPPKNMWKHIKPTLRIIDKMAVELGTPVAEIFSVYRSPSYNKAVWGSRKSCHMQNQAVDVAFKNVGAWRAAKVARHLRDKKKEFKGGIGKYRSFVHIDTRGANYNW